VKNPNTLILPLDLEHRLLIRDSAAILENEIALAPCDRDDEEIGGCCLAREDPNPCGDAVPPD